MEEGGPAADLNTVIPPGSGLQLTYAFNINDRGEILAKSDLGHVVLLVPCEEDRGDCVNVLAATPSREATVFVLARTQVGRPQTVRDAMRTWRERLKLLQIADGLSLQ